MQETPTRSVSKGYDMNRKFIPVCEPLLEGNEKKYVLEALDSGWISSSGKYIGLFEEAFARYCGVRHGIAVCNGTMALHLGLVALGIGKGDEVIIPDFTMISSAFAVCYTGAKPVFVDAEPLTWNIDPQKIESKVTSRTKAIMPVHVYGHPCDMEKILELARRHKLYIIEDAAEVHGAEYKGKKCGSLGTLAGFSFFANKIATTGEGGMVVTDDDGLAEKCRYYKNLCFPIGSNRVYEHNHVGFNYRMSNIHAAIGLAQVEKLEQYVAKRRNVHSYYQQHLEHVPGVTLQPEASYAKNVYWMNGITIDRARFGLSRDELALRLREKGIDSRPFFVGMHNQNSLAQYGCDCSTPYPISDWLQENGLYLPSASGLTEGEVQIVCREIETLAHP
jgi:perosamine synthetase